MSILVGLYDDLATVQRLVEELKDNGYNQTNMHLATHDPRAQERGSGGFFDSLQNLFGRKPHDLGKQPQSLVQELTSWGIPEEDAGNYAEAVRRGNTLLMMQCPDDTCDDTRQMMENYHPQDIQELAQGWRQQGWQRYDESERPFTQDEIDRERMQRRETYAAGAQDETHIPTVEEEMRVGKRAVQRGGVRVRSYVTERPVEETHTVRDESVNVERRPTDRPLREGDMDAAFQERTFDVTETDEELVTNKDAHVVEDVVIRKDVQERPETVRDTLRKTEVETDNLDSGTRGTTRGSRDFNSFANDFRTHYNTEYGGRGQDYDYYQPGYRYGYELANNSDYRGRQWSDIEPDARREWERTHKGSAWNDFKNSIRFAWERARSGASDASSRTSESDQGYTTGSQKKW